MGSNKVWTVEVLSEDGRARKYHSPLFLTPDGLLHAFPERAEHFFQSFDQAESARKSLGGAIFACVKGTYPKHIWCTARYRRWAAEVKSKGPDVAPGETHRTLEEKWAIYCQGGRSALRNLYTASYVSSLMRTFRAAGLLPDGSN